MSLSRQNSVHTREPSAQDRLVSLNESQSSSQQPPGGAVGGAGASTQYGVTSMNSDTPRRRPQRPTLAGFSPFMPRSDSCLSSHVSSPDLYTSASTGTETYLGTDRDSAEGRHCTQVMVETHDIGAGGDDDSYSRKGSRSKPPSASTLRRMQAASQRRSWHFDDRTDISDASDLIDITTNSRLPTSQRQQKKPPVPPRRDKQGSLPGLPLPPDATDSRDLLEMNGASSPSFVTKGRESSVPRQGVTQGDQPKMRSTNPFLDDSIVQTTPGVPLPPPPPPPIAPKPSMKTSGVMHHADDTNCANTESWENQPWPEPPPPPPPPPLPESPVSSDAEAEGANSGTSKLNNVPESLQYLPNNSLRRPKKGQDGQGSFQMQEQRSVDTDNQVPVSIISAGQQDVARRSSTPSSKQVTENRQPSNLPSAKTKRQAPPVPIMREYDNPLFNDQSVDERRAKAYKDGFTPPVSRHTTATSFINPSIHSSTNPSNPPPYYSVVNTLESEPTSYRRHSTHYGYAHPLEDPRSNSPPKYARPRQPNGNVYENENHPCRGGNSNSTSTKSRPRQVKREHQQRRNNNNNPSDSQNPQRQPSPRDQYYGSSPDLMSRSPRVSRKRLDGTGGGDGSSPRRARPNRQREDHRPYGHVEPTKYAAGNFPPHWADSDL